MIKLMTKIVDWLYKAESDKRLNSQAGVTMIEYVLIAGVLAIAVALVFGGFGTTLLAKFNSILSGIN